LRLRPSESEAVARLLGHGRRLGRAFHGRSAGWMAGLVLLLGGGSTATRRLEVGSREDAFASLAAEIVDPLPAASEEPLLRTAFLPRLTPGMAEDLSGNPRAGRLLEDFYRSSFFTARRGTTDVVYEYHGLLRGFLLARGRTTLPADEQQRLARDA